MTDSSIKVIVTGLVGLHPVGGVAWDYLQYALGLSRLGHDVYYHEDTWSWPYQPVQRTNTADATYSIAFLKAFFEKYAPELQSKWHYVHLHETSFGMDAAHFDEVARTADLFINVSGACMIPDRLSARCVKAFVDTDPGYNQILFSERFAWSENVDRWGDMVLAHDRHFTYAENIHNPDCIVPKVGFDWQTTRMPIVVDAWPQQDASSTGPWTTVMTWNAFKGTLTYRGVEYKSKGAEFENIIDLPGRSGARFQVAVGGIDAPLERLADHGWEVLDGPSATLTPLRYQQFLAQSRGEISTAKHVYVHTRSGWFSCRSACYLAAARPVVVQDTGFGARLPVGEGLFTFTNADQALAGIEAVESNYERHSNAASALARDHFASDKVLPDFLDRAFSRTRPLAPAMPVSPVSARGDLRAR